MRRVVLDMQNALCTDAIAEALRRFDPDFDPVMSDSPEKTVFLCDAVLANVLIMEVTAYAPRRLEERMKICDGLKKPTRAAKPCWWWMRTFIRRSRRTSKTSSCWD